MDDDDDEIALPELIGWYERNVARTTTLAVVRSVVQGAFPLLATSAVSSLGKNRPVVEAVRAELGDPEFALYVQCQVEGFKRDRSPSGEGFYAGYLVEDRAQDHYDEFRERLSYNGFYTVRSEVFRKCYPAECNALSEYFRGMVTEEEEPDFFEIRTRLILTSPPVWVYYAFSREETRALGEARERLWISGKTWITTKKLGEDRTEYGRAAVEALYYTAIGFSPFAATFTVVPAAAEEYPLAYQIGFQFRSRKDEFLKEIPPLRVTFDV